MSILESLTGKQREFLEENIKTYAEAEKSGDRLRMSDILLQVFTHELSPVGGAVGSPGFSRKDFYALVEKFKSNEANPTSTRTGPKM